MTYYLVVWLGLSCSGWRAFLPAALRPYVCERVIETLWTSKEDQAIKKAESFDCSIPVTMQEVRGGRTKDREIICRREVVR